MQTLGVRAVWRLRKSKSAPWMLVAWRSLPVTFMVGGLKPTSLPSSRRKLAVKPLSLTADPVEPLEEVDVEEGAAELAVGDALEPDLLLLPRMTSAMHSSSTARNASAGSRPWRAAHAPRAGASDAAGCRRGRPGMVVWSWIMSSRTGSHDDDLDHSVKQPVETWF